MKRVSIASILIVTSASAALWCVYAFTVHYIPLFTYEVLHADPRANLWVKWIYEFYPRLHTEKWRFNDSFFFAKVHQVLLRVTLTIQTLFVLYSFWSSMQEQIKKTNHQLFDVVVKRQLIFYITLLLYCNLLLIVYHAVQEFQELQFFRAFYQPIGIAKVLLPVFPSMALLWLLYLVLIGSMVAVVAFPKKWISASLAAIGFIYYQLVLFGFGKYDHGFATLTYALMIYPFFLWEAEKSQQSDVPAWSLVLIQCMICLSYVYCGLEKLFISGIHWFYSDNLQQYLLIHHTPLGLQLASHALWCHALSFGVVVLQCSFAALPFYKKLKYILLPAGFIFHTAAWILLDAGGWFNPWWGVYLFFLFPLQPQETK